MLSGDSGAEPSPPALLAQTWQATVILGALTLILGLVVSFHPTGSLNVLAVLLGILMILSGLFHLIRVFDREEMHRVWTGIAGLMFVVVGVVLIRHLHLTRALIGLVIGITWIVQGLTALIGGIGSDVREGRAWGIAFGVIRVAARIGVAASTATRNSMASTTEAAIGFPTASGTIPPENGMLSEILAERGWNTYMVGKWHLCPTVEMNVASTRRNWPSGRGFERWYGFLGAETNQWYPDLVYDNHPGDQPKLPSEGYHLTDDIPDKALEFIQDAKTVAPDKPFFLYYAPGACHAPHHVSKEWADRLRGG